MSFRVTLTSYGSDGKRGKDGQTMLEKELNGIWKLRISGENVYGIPEEYIEAEVPGSVYWTLLS